MNFSEINQKELAAWSDLENRIRRYLRDYAELNTLIDGAEHSSRHIWEAIESVTSMAESIPPYLGKMPVLRIPTHIVIDLAVSRLLMSAALLYTRNDVAFSTGGTSVQLDQGNRYIQIAQMLQQSGQEALRAWKLSENYRLAVAGTSGVHSDWQAININPISWYRDDVLG